MRVLTSAVLVLEAIVLGLAIPAALVSGGQPTWFGALLASLAIFALALPGAARRAWYVGAGWSLQGLVIAAGGYDLVTSRDSGILPMLLILGLIFSCLWGTALHLGRKVEAVAAGQPGPVE